MVKNLRIVIADDHDLIRRGLKTLLEAQPGWKVCAEATKGPEAVVKSEELRPDVVVIDVCMPELNGIEATRQIRKVSPRTEVLVLSVHHSERLIREVLEAGARGFIVKSDSDSDLVRAIQALENHKPFFTSYATEMLLGRYGSEGTPGLTDEILEERLTSREREVVQLLAEGRTSKQIATLLNISAKTAETHRANIMRKLQFHSVGEIVRYAVRNQIIDP
jgi:DNA-binding NarL/FixJ family response regulator